MWCRRAMIPGEIFTSFAEFQGIVSVSDFWFPRRLQELHSVLLGLLGRLCFTRVWLYPLSCQILYHNGVSVIVARLNVFTSNFVIRSNQITNIFRSGHTLYQHVFCQKPLLFSSSHRYPNLGPSESAYKHCAYPNPVSAFVRGSTGCSWDDLEVSWLHCSGFLQSSGSVLSWTKFSSKSGSESGNSCDISLCTSFDSLFLFWFSFSVDSRWVSPKLSIGTSSLW